MIDVINALIKQGHSVRYRHRKDGGYLITELDGIRFSGARGNTYARTIYGSYLSKAREFQLARINKARKRVSTLPNVIKRKIARVQRKWRQAHDTTKGTIKTSSVRWVYEHEGEEEALRSLEKAERYATGLAYEENVNWLAQRLRLDGLNDLADKVENMSDRFKEEWIKAVYEVIYDFEKGVIQEEELERRIEVIIG